MNPDDFLTLATTLAQGKGQAEWRSSISRAYYSAFHAACGLVESIDVTLPLGASAHQKVTYCLQQSQDSELAVAGSKLNAFREARNGADYRLKDSQFASKKSAELYLAIARQIIVAISTRDADPEVRRSIRQYARDMLKLQVRGPD
ncbi:MAG: hypothetical protein ACR2FY_23150 [Pirellulaceae bacterium]